MTGLVCVLAIVCGAAPEAPFAIDVPPASLRVSAPVKDGVAHYDLQRPFSVTLAVEGNAGLEVKAPEPITESQGWTLLSKQPPQVAVIRAGRVRWQQTFVFDPLLRPGQHALQIGPLRYREPPGDWQTIDWPALPVEVATPAENAKPADVRDITSIEDLPTSPSFWPAVLWTGLTIAVGTAIGFILARWRRRRNDSARLSAAERAGRELERLRALNLPATGASARFHGMLANVLRTYLDNRFGIHARRRTTEELQAELNGIELANAAKHELVVFLHDCDLAKFAGGQPSKDDCDRRLTWVADFVRQTAHAVTPPSPPA